MILSVSYFNKSISYIIYLFNFYVCAQNENEMNGPRLSLICGAIAYGATIEHQQTILLSKLMNRPTRHTVKSIRWIGPLRNKFTKNRT